MSQITYADKVALSPQPDVADINKVTNDDMNMIKNAHNDTDNKAYSIGKKLWEGTFTSGSITVDGLSNYTIIVVMLDGNVPCIGTTNWGFGGISRYGGYQIDNYAYRFYPNGNTLTIDTYNKGGTNGSSQVAVKKIYGIF